MSAKNPPIRVDFLRVWVMAVGYLLAPILGELAR